MNRREYIKSMTLSMGFMVSAGAVSDLLISCQKQANLDWKPVFLDTNQANTIAERVQKNWECRNLLIKC
ncbi:MAG: hypothetical protein MUF45_18610 [Spirosomaceae bacterium]|nr:hypothetical protein [Spirosomataceae bacterium]